MAITVVILTRDEEIHISRAIASARLIASNIFVIDSGSIDRTVQIAIELGATVLKNEWVSHSVQFNWALGQIPRDTEWVLRLDADEVLTPELTDEISRCLVTLSPECHGVNIPRRIVFLGRPIRWGGIFPNKVLRLFRFGHGICETRLMDEHIVVDGATTSFRGEILDKNERSLTWWTQKHNTYSSLEAIELLNLELQFLKRTPLIPSGNFQGPFVKRWVKEHLYVFAPAGFRAFFYFVYRYILRFGFLDGTAGLAFHFLQGFWYRFLVDMKLHELRLYIRDHKVTPKVAIEKVLGVSI